MGKCRTFCLTFLSLVFISIRANAQDTSATHAKDSSYLPNYGLDKKTMDSIDRELKLLLAHSKSHFHIGIDYLSNNIYYGRKDTTTRPYLNGSFGYYHKSGLFVNASASYLALSGEGRIDLFTIEAGYTFYAKKFQGQVTASKYFYNSESDVVDADLKGDFSFFGGYDFGFIRPTLAPSLMISNKMDYALTFGLEHTFYALDNQLDITPTINAGGSTQNYYNSYYENRKFKLRLLRNQNISTISGEVLNAHDFKILDYECSVPINFTVKKWTFSLSPAYIIPVHPAVVAVTTQFFNQPPKTRTGEEKISNSFFLQAGVMVKL